MGPARFLPAAAIVLIATCGMAADAVSPAAAFHFLDARGATIATRHAIAVRVVAPRSFHATPVVDRAAIFGGHPYQVSLAALLSPDAAVMVHAERVADASGASNYDRLPATGWPDPRFRMRTMCAAIDRATIAEEHDIAFLDRNGWSPEGTIALEQYLATTADHNQEVVISLVLRVPNCDDPGAARTRFQALRSRIRVMARR